MKKYIKIVLVLITTLAFSDFSDANAYDSCNSGSIIHTEEMVPPSLLTPLIETKCIEIRWEADYAYYQLHGNHTVSHISNVLDAIKYIYSNNGINLNLITAESKIYKIKNEDPYRDFTQIGIVHETFNENNPSNSYDIAILFSGNRELDHHGISYPDSSCGLFASQVGLGIGVGDDHKGKPLSVDQEARIHAHELGHILSSNGGDALCDPEGYHDTTGIMHCGIPFTQVGNNSFTSNRITQITNNLGSDCYKCNDSTPTPTSGGSSSKVVFTCGSGCGNDLSLNCNVLTAKEYNNTIIISNTRITNNGSTTAYNVQMEFALVGSAGEIPLTPVVPSSAIIGQIAPGATITGLAPVLDFPEDLSGSYQMKVKLNGTSNSCHSTESIDINVPPPPGTSGDIDLAFDICSPITETNNGYSIPFRVINWGAETVQQTSLGVYLSNDEFYDQNDLLVEQFDIPILEHRATIYHQYYQLNNISLQQGDKYIILKLDKDDIATETTESNNFCINYIPSNCTSVTSSNPYHENFENFTQGSSFTCVTGITLENDWINSTDDDVDWSADSGGTSSSGTGPLIDSNPGTNTGKYLYVEVSGCNNKKAILQSPCLDLSGLTTPTLSFSYHMYGANQGTLELGVSTVNTPHIVWIPIATGNQGNVWKKADGWVLSATDGFQILFRATTGSGYTSDIAIDDIQIKEGSSSGYCGDDANTLLLLPFDNTLNGINGETPTASSALSFTSGRHSNALNVNGSNSNPSLSYTVEDNLNPHKGTLEAWVKPAWNGNDGEGYTILSYGGWGGILILKDGANNLRLILNLWSPSGFPEIGVAKNISDWQANQWKHVAFTWGDGKLQLYIDGSLAAQQTYTVPLATIHDSRFQIGEHGDIDWKGAIDDLRISKVVRSQTQIREFMNNCTGNKIEQTQAIDTRNYPNPFTHHTNIEYTLPKDSPVTLTIYNASGKQIAVLHDKETRARGTHTATFEGGLYPAGIYYYTIQAGEYVGTQKMILVK